MYTKRKHEAGASGGSLGGNKGTFMGHKRNLEGEELKNRTMIGQQAGIRRKHGPSPRNLDDHAVTQSTDR